MKSNCLSSRCNLRKAPNTSASSHSARPASTPFRARLRFASSSAGPELSIESTERAPLGIGAFVDPRAAALRAEDFDQCFAPSLAARRSELHDQSVRVAVRDKTRKPVRLSMHEPQGIGRFQWNFGAPERERRCYPPFEQIGAGDFRFVETPDAGPDLRGGTVRRPGEETAVGGPDAHAIAGVRCSADFGDRAGEDPRMAPQ